MHVAAGPEDKATASLGRCDTLPCCARALAGNWGRLGDACARAGPLLTSQGAALFPSGAIPSICRAARRSEKQIKWQRLRKLVFEDVKRAMEAAGLSRDRGESFLEIRHGVLCRHFDRVLH